MLYDSKTIKFNLIIYDAMNEKRRMLAIKEDDVIMLIHRNNKDKQFVKDDSDDFNSINRETYISYKTADRKFKHLSIKC